MPAGSERVHTCTLLYCIIQEAQLPQRNSTSAAHMEGEGLGSPAHSPAAPSGYAYAYGRIRNPQKTYVKRAVH